MHSFLQRIWAPRIEAAAKGVCRQGAALAAEEVRLKPRLRVVLAQDCPRFFSPHMSNFSVAAKRCRGKQDFLDAHEKVHVDELRAAREGMTEKTKREKRRWH